MNIIERVEQLKNESGTVPEAHALIFHYAFNSRTGASFERVSDQDMHPGDVVKVVQDGSDEVESYIVTKREPVLVLADDCDVIVTFIQLEECIPNNERTV